MQCSNWDGRLDNQNLINTAIIRLQTIGVLSPGELNGVQVRWCPLSGAVGITPDRGKIYLDPSLQSNTYATASTLAHETTHVRQYRRMGTDIFKCEYSKQFTSCGGCQDRRNSLEREAYDYESSIAYRLSQVIPPVEIQPPQPQPPPGFPPSPQGFPSGYGMQVCNCWGPNPPATAIEPRCTSGGVQVMACPGFCSGGGNPYGYVCQ